MDLLSIGQRVRIDDNKRREGTIVGYTVVGPTPKINHELRHRPQLLALVQLLTGLATEDGGFITTLLVSPDALHVVENPKYYPFSPYTIPERVSR